MFVRKGQKLGSVLVDKSNSEPQPRKSRHAPKKSGAKKSTPPAPPADPSDDSDEREKDGDS